MDKNTLIQLLKKDVVPALGCTEPVCVALAAAYAAERLEGAAERIELVCNAGIYKNGMSAGIPHCDKVGLDYAAALGAQLKNPQRGLELLADTDAGMLQKAAGLVEAGAVKVSMDPAISSLYVRCCIRAQDGEAVCIIRDAHTNMVYLEKNGQLLFEKPAAPSGSSGDTVVDELKEMKISAIRALVDSADEEELSFLMDGVEMNEALAAYSEDKKVGVGLADAFRHELGSAAFADSLLSRIVIKVSAAAENRLDGCPLPTMSSSGAGTKGLVVILPVHETAMALGVSREKELKALALAHLLNRYINAHSGKLSPMCTCVMASSTAVAAAMCYLMGGSDEQISWAIRNMAGSVTGMICDGGKVGCALKVSVGSTAALLAAISAVNNAALRVSDGICAQSAEDCIRNMASIGIRGMKDTDAEILRIMTSK